MLFPPIVGRSRFSIHGPLDKSEIWPSILTWSITFPNMSLKISNFFVKCVKNTYPSSSHLVYSIHVKMKFWSVRLMIVILVGHEQEAMYHLMDQCLYQISS